MVPLVLGNIHMYLSGFRVQGLALARTTARRDRTARAEMLYEATPHLEAYANWEFNCKKGSVMHSCRDRASVF